MIRFLSFFLAASLAVGKLPAQSPVSPVRFVGQLSSGLLGMPVGFVAGGLITRSIAHSMGQGEDAASSIALVGAYSGAALATAIGPTVLASRGARASYLQSVGGAVAGGLGSVLLIKLNKIGDPDSRACRFVCLASAAAVFLLPSVGATIAANASRR